MKKEILKTNDYSKFVLPDWNRDQSQANVDRLVRSIQRHNLLWACPVLVYEKNGKLYIEDGQHRYLAAQHLGVDLYYAIVPEASCAQDSVASQLNGAQNKWSFSSYIKEQAERYNNKDAQWMFKVASRYSTTIAVVYNLLGRSFEPREGEDVSVSVEKKHKVESFLAHVRDLKAAGIKGMTSVPIRAYWRLFNLDGWDTSRMIDKVIELSPGDAVEIAKSYTEAQYNLVDIYNHKLRRDSSTRIDIPRGGIR